MFNSLCGHILLFCCPKETADSLDVIEKELEDRFSSQCPRPMRFKGSTSEFVEVAMTTLSNVILTAQQSVPRPDRIIIAMIKRLFLNEILNIIVNCSLHYTWIPNSWKI